MSLPEAPPAPAAAPSEAVLRRDWTLFTLLTYLFGFGFAVYAGVFQNFLRDVVRLTVYSWILLGAWLKLIALLREKYRVWKHRGPDRFSASDS